MGIAEANCGWTRGNTAINGNVLRAEILRPGQSYGPQQGSLQPAACRFSLLHQTGGRGRGFDVGVNIIYAHKIFSTSPLDPLVVGDRYPLTPPKSTAGGTH